MINVLYEDAVEIATNINIKWNELKGSVVLVTGATGEIGSAIIRALHEANKRYDLNIKVLAFGRNVEKGSILSNVYGAEFYHHDICQPLTVDGCIDYIFHCAAITGSPDMVSKPVDVAEVSIKGTSNTLTLAKEKEIKSMVYLSSMEVYGLTDPALPWVTEEDLGFIDLKSHRSCYPEAKRMCECLCSCWLQQYGVPVKIARLAQTFGAGTPRNDTRVVTQFARSIVEEKNIVLHTDGESQGNYCYISDAISALLILLLKGENGETYNIANSKSSMTIKQMAELVALDVGGGKASVVIDRPSNIEAFGYAPNVTRRLSAEKIEQLGWKAKYDLTDMYTRMIASWCDK